MSLRKWLRRRAGLPLPNEHGPVWLARWDVRECRGCGLLILFQPGQKQNRCGWCEQQVTRGVG